MKFSKSERMSQMERLEKMNGEFKINLIKANQRYRYLNFLSYYHALTTIKDKEQLKKNIFNASIDMLSLGIDPEKTIFFNQNEISEVLELSLILSNLVSLSFLERSHCFKDKINKGISPNLGLFSYPVLMAADILLYKSDIIPVGKDQIQHIEMTRDIANMFNNTYGDYFVLPKYEVSETTAIIPGTDKQKMSKSYKNTIPIFNSEKELKKLVNSIQTDSTDINSQKDFNTCTIFKLCSLFMNDNEIENLKEQYITAGKGYGHFKIILFNKINDYFSDFYAKREFYENNP